MWENEWFHQSLCQVWSDYFCLGKKANGKALSFWTKSSENNGKWAQETEIGESRTGKEEKIRKGKRPRFCSIKRLHIFNILKHDIVLIYKIKTATYVYILFYQICASTTL